MKAWGGRFSAEPDADAAAFGRSIDVDAELAIDDIRGSLAHVSGLRAAGLLDEAEAAAIGDGLRRLEAEVQAGTIAWDPALEDIHLNIEMALAERIGPVAGKLHTGRSRNDQVATDLRLWLKRRLASIDEAIVGLERALVSQGLAAPRGGHGRAHARAAGTTGALRPPPAGLRGDARTGPWPPGGCRAPGRRLAARVRARSRGPAFLSTAKRWPERSASPG